MTQTTDQELYEQWREDYALTYEPNYDEHLEADCKAAFLAGMQAARRAQMVPNGYESGVMSGNRVSLFFDTQENADAWFEQFCDIYDAAAPHQPEALKRENPATKPEAAPVPKFSPVAQTKLDYLLEAGEKITGYAIQNKDGRRGAIDCHGFVYWWNDAAPVQMPEFHKVLELAADALKVLTYKGDYGSRDKRNHKLATIANLRQLLAQHGIK